MPENMVSSAAKQNSVYKAMLPGVAALHQKVCSVKKHFDDFFHRNSNSMENSFSPHNYSDEVIITKILHITAVVACAKTCDLMASL